MDNQLCYKCGKPKYLAKDYPNQQNSKSQSDPAKSQPTTNQSIRQGNGQKKAHFQSATVQDSQSESGSEEEYTNEDEASKN
jgi:hypothetical protein